jgi:hypothetical protein
VRRDVDVREDARGGRDKEGEGEGDTHMHGRKLLSLLANSE